MIGKVYSYDPLIYRHYSFWSTVAIQCMKAKVDNIIMNLSCLKSLFVICHSNGTITGVWRAIWSLFTFHVIWTVYTLWEAVMAGTLLLCHHDVMSTAFWHVLCEHVFKRRKRKRSNRSNCSCKVEILHGLK